MAFAFTFSCTAMSGVDIMADRGVVRRARRRCADARGGVAGASGSGVAFGYAVDRSAAATATAAGTD
jgi:hypothetical protein